MCVSSFLQVQTLQCGTSSKQQTKLHRYEGQQTHKRAKDQNMPKVRKQLVIKSIYFPTSSFIISGQRGAAVNYQF